MSHIPNSAMPHAGSTAELEPEGTSSPTISDRANKLIESARANPTAMVAASAAVIAGVAAAAAIPLVRNRSVAAKRSAAGKKSASGAAKKN